MRLKIWPGFTMRLARPSPHGVERGRARPIDAGQAEQMRRLIQRPPSLLGRDTPLAALAARLQLAHLVNPAASAVAVDSGGRQISDPAEAL